jgi:hypothetical protein
VNEDTVTITTFNCFTDRIFYRYLHYHSVGNNFTDRFTDENRLLVISFMSVKKNTDGFTDRKYPAKKIPALIHRQNYSIGDW